jgi:hypothetical protein
MSLWGWITVGVLVVLIGVAGFVGYRLGLKSGRRHAAPTRADDDDDDAPKKPAKPAAPAMAKKPGAPAPAAKPGAPAPAAKPGAPAAPAISDTGTTTKATSAARLKRCRVPVTPTPLACACESGPGRRWKGQP